MAYLMTEGSSDIPTEITNALQDAMEIATKNVPKIEGKVVIAVDVSGSMHSPVTGDRGDYRTTSKVRYIDVAALVGASIARVNPTTRIIPFESKALTDYRFNSRDAVMTNAEKLRNLPCGGTNCSAPLIAIAKEEVPVDVFIFVSDNESWIDQPNYGRFAVGRSYGGGSANEARTMTMEAWEKIKRKNPKAKMVCIDISPNNTTQATNRDDIFNVGGFNDNIWEVIQSFVTGNGADQWVDAIEATTL
jgi:60 kDa SS-A/Ro ribonucleoprotein